METKITKRTLKNEAAARAKRFREVMKIEHSVQEELDESVDSVDEMIPSRLERRIVQVENKEELKNDEELPEYHGKRKRV